MKNPCIIAFVGLSFTGKSTAREITQQLLSEHGHPNEYVVFGTVAETHRRDDAGEWPPEQANLTMQQKETIIREEWRKQFGMGVMAIKAEKEIDDHFSSGKYVLIDNLYSEEEREILVEKYGEESVVLVALAADWEVRVRRAKHREYRPLSEAELKERDDNEIKVAHKAPPIARAHYTIVNNADEQADPDKAKAELQSELANRVLAGIL